MNTVLTLSPKSEPYNKDEILRYLGAKTMDKATEELIDSCIAEADSVIHGIICYKEFNIKKNDGGLDLGFCKTQSKLLLSHLCGCESVILFAATIGISIDRLIMKYAKTSPSRAVVLSAIGSERVESLCNAFEKTVETECAEKVSRVSCGYGDIPLSMQKDIISVLDTPRKIGITLGDNLLMTPKKSVTAIIGIR